MSEYDQRYLRQITLPGFGAAKQTALAGAHVALVGAGGLGSPAILYLAAAGVGRLTIIDDDVVELSNLHRQVIHTTARIGTPKANSAAAAVAALNPQVTVSTVRQRLTWPTAVDMLAEADVVLDGADNFDTRHVISHACARLGIPHVWAAILGFDAQLAVFWAGHGPVYEDLYPVPPAPGVVPSCAQAGVLGPLVGIMGSAMAMEAIKLLTDIGEPLLGRLAYLDSLATTWDTVPLAADPTVTERVRTAAPPQQNAGVPEVDELPAGAAILDVREANEVAAGAIPGSVHLLLAEVLAATTVPAVATGPVVVYCAGGARSAQAVRHLRELGATAAVSLRGGYERWRTVTAETGGFEPPEV